MQKIAIGAGALVILLLIALLIFHRVSGERNGNSEERTQGNTQAVQEETVEPTETHEEVEQTETDWKAEARKWEQRAKKSLAAEQELEALKAAQMTEQEKVIARAEKAEQELAELKQEAARLEAAKSISQHEGVPLSLLEYCANEEAMAAFAKEYKANIPTQTRHAAGKAKGSNVNKEGGAKVSTREAFAEFASQQFK